MIIKCYSQKLKCIKISENTIKTRYKNINIQNLFKHKNIMIINSINKINS